jgi:hypothetical protein
MWRIDILPSVTQIGLIATCYLPTIRRCFVPISEVGVCSCAYCKTHRSALRHQPKLQAQHQEKQLQLLQQILCAASHQPSSGIVPRPGTTPQQPTHHEPSIEPITEAPIFSLEQCNALINEQQQHDPTPLPTKQLYHSTLPNVQHALRIGPDDFTAEVLNDIVLKRLQPVVVNNFAASRFNKSLWNPGYLKRVVGEQYLNVRFAASAQPVLVVACSNVPCSSDTCMSIATIWKDRSPYCEMPERPSLGTLTMRATPH